MKRQLRLYSLVMALAILSGCTTKVLVPPRMPLRDYGTVGIIIFSSNSTGNLAEHATRKFMEAVQAAQPGVRILELGGEQRVLRAVEYDGLDFEAMRAIGEKWNVDAVFAGHLEVTDVNPNLDFTRLAKSMSLQADVEAIEREIRERDLRDSTRADSPLTPASDALRVDTTQLSPDEVVDRMLAAVEERRREGR